MKEGFIIIPITKAESKYLISKGLRFHEHVFKSGTSHHYYAMDREWVKEILAEPYTSKRNTK